MATRFPCGRSASYTEPLVYTQLIPRDLPIHYFSSNNSNIEIDFLIQKGVRIISIEVKTEVNVKSKSLRTYIDKHPTLKGMRLSMLPHSDQGWMENVPLYNVNFGIR